MKPEAAPPAGSCMIQTWKKQWQGKRNLCPLHLFSSLPLCTFLCLLHLRDFFNEVNNNSNCDMLLVEKWWSERRKSLQQLEEITMFFLYLRVFANLACLQEHVCHWISFLVTPTDLKQCLPCACGAVWCPAQLGVGLCAHRDMTHYHHRFFLGRSYQVGDWSVLSWRLLCCAARTFLAAFN